MDHWLFCPRYYCCSKDLFRAQNSVMTHPPRLSSQIQEKQRFRKTQDPGDSDSVSPAGDSFLQLHQEKSHNGEEENFKLSVTRFYGKDRLAYEIAEAVILRSRKGDVCNLKSEGHDPPLIQVRRQVQRGLWLAEGHNNFFKSQGFSILCLLYLILLAYFIYLFNSNLLMIRTGIETCWENLK